MFEGLKLLSNSFYIPKSKYKILGKVQDFETANTKAEARHKAAVKVGTEATEMGADMLIHDDVFSSKHGNPFKVAWYGVAVKITDANYLNKLFNKVM